MKKYFFGKFHSNSPILPRSLCLLCLGIIFWLYVCVIIYLEYFDFCVWLWVLCVAFYLSFIWLFVWSIRFPLNWVFPWEVILIFSSFHLISVSCPTINKRISGFFRILGSKRSVWGKSSYISFLRIPCSFIYRIVQYICYVWVWFVDLIYALLNYVRICSLCFGLCALRFIFYFSFLSFRVRIV